MNILCADIGGTHTRLQLVQAKEEKARTQFVCVGEHIYASREFGTFDEVLEDFLHHHGANFSPDCACFGVAGPISQVNGITRAKVTNLPWLLDAKALATHLGGRSVYLINDFEAIGYGLDSLDEEHLVPLQQGKTQPRGNQLIIGAGTGLGVAMRIWQTDRYQVIASEAGHANFAPANQLQLDFTQYLLTTHGSSSKEAVLSGPGLVDIYVFFCQRADQLHTPAVQRILATADPANQIATAAANGTDPLAKEALDLFVSCYGSEAGNLALTAMARGGVYIAGGVAAKNIGRLQKGDFIQAFNSKGKMTSMMEQIPVKVISHPRIGLLGCWLYAFNYNKIK